ncbi:hypothetical protein [Devosia epidermidihirudinis]|uniref:hypothetical protein n=1 Tax=Devosia epidermidihirudinis TaxID=1293439 RepID=UPI000697B8A8|nr:hypothetical protein [Devosia epidermidihirudinis]
MAINRKTEDRVLDKDERELVEAARHPALSGMDSEGLRTLARRLRERRDRARTIADKQRRNVRGKGTSAAKFDQADAGNRQKAALLQAAIARLNKEYARRTDA